MPTHRRIDIDVKRIDIDVKPSPSTTADTQRSVEYPTHSSATHISGANVSQTTAPSTRPSLSNGCSHGTTASANSAESASVPADASRRSTTSSLYRSAVLTSRPTCSWLAGRATAPRAHASHKSPGQSTQTNLTFLVGIARHRPKRRKIHTVV